MKQRLGIAAALLNDPQLLLLDEPANGLDPAGIVGMRDSLRALAAAGKTVFVSSHILSEVQQLADVVGIIAPRAARPRGLGRDAAARGGLGPHPRGARRDPGGRPRSSTRLAGAGTVDPGGRPGGRLAGRQDRPRPVGGAEPGAGAGRASSPRGSRAAPTSSPCSSGSPGRVPTSAARPGRPAGRIGRRRRRRRGRTIPARSPRPPGGRHEAASSPPCASSSDGRRPGSRSCCSSRSWG